MSDVEKKQVWALNDLNEQNDIMEWYAKLPAEFKDEGIMKLKAAYLAGFHGALMRLSTAFGETANHMATANTGVNIASANYFYKWAEEVLKFGSEKLEVKK